MDQLPAASIAEQLHALAESLLALAARIGTRMQFAARRSANAGASDADETRADEQQLSASRRLQLCAMRCLSAYARCLAAEPTDETRWRALIDRLLQLAKVCTSTSVHSGTYSHVTGRVAVNAKNGVQVKQVELQMRVAEVLPCAVLGALALEGLDAWLSDCDYASAGALAHVFSSSSSEHISACVRPCLFLLSSFPLTFRSHPVPFRRAQRFFSPTRSPSRPSGRCLHVRFATNCSHRPALSLLITVSM